MSHWRKFTSNVLEDIDEKILRKAVADMGFTYDTSIKSVANAYGHSKCSAGLVSNGKQLSLGFNFVKKGNKTSLQLNGDFFMTGFNEATFMDTLSQMYQKHRIIDICENQGWALDEDTVNVDDKNNITFDVYNYA